MVLVCKMRVMHGMGMHHAPEINPYLHYSSQQTDPISTSKWTH